ncbi:MAG: hypothetical protein JST86_00130 [Bacteroidetes bacterium]|nr:hypothetical protein [Bacteroidota bacterium]
MLEQVKNKMLALKKVAGIELTFLSENLYVINCIIIENRKEKVIVTDTFYNIKNIVDLKGKITNQIPVALVLNGKGLIHKKTAVISDVLPPDIFPGTNPSDFLFQYFDGLPSPDLSIIRKAVAEKIITELASVNISTTSLSLAFYDLEFVAGLITDSTVITTTQYRVNIKDQQIREYHVTSTEEKEDVVKPEINIANEYIRSNFLIAYAAAVKLLAGGFKDGNTIELKSILDNRRKFQQSTMLKLYAISFLGIVLCLLLVNFFIYSHYFSKNNELLSGYQFSLQQAAKYDTLKKSLNNKKQFLASAGWMNDTRMISFYADRIAATVPESVTLTSLNLYPAVSRYTGASKQWFFQQDTILITGKCSDPTILDSWVKEIRSIKNINQSKINSYNFKKQGDAGIFTAEVLIK